MAANALSWYTQEYSVVKNLASAKCTGIRQWGDGQKGFFDLTEGDVVTLDMGYRVYENATATRARIHRDYTGLQFELLDKGSLAGSVMLSAVTATAMAAISILLVF